MFWTLISHWHMTGTIVQLLKPLGNHSTLDDGDISNLDDIIPIDGELHHGMKANLSNPYGSIRKCSQSLRDGWIQFMQ